jgi:GT2 family glycosyltransferase
MKHSSVFVVVLTWNGKADTIECLRSLARITDPEISVILVDNGSNDGTAEAVREEYPGIELIETGENLGYTGGNNVGIRRALDRGAEYVLILNNDTLVDPGFVRELLAVAARSERIGFVSPKIYFLDPPDLLWFAGARFSPWTGYGRMIGYRRRDRGQYDQVREIDRPCGCVMLVSRRLCVEAGLLDPSLFLYADEIEWMLRAKKKGFKAFFAPKAIVWHKVSASVGKEGHPDAFYYGVRNTLYALNKHEAAPSTLPGKLRNLLVEMTFLFSTFNLGSGAWEGFRATWEGVRDYKRSKMGRRGSVNIPK